MDCLSEIGKFFFLGGLSVGSLALNLQLSLDTPLLQVLELLVRIFD